MYAIVVDYYCWNEEKGEHTKPMYLGIAYPPKNIYVFDEEHNSRSFRWGDKEDAEEYLKKFKKNTDGCFGFENPRVEEIEKERSLD